MQDPKGQSKYPRDEEAASNDSKLAIPFALPVLSNRRNALKLKFQSDAAEKDDRSIWILGEFQNTGSYKTW